MAKCDSLSYLSGGSLDVSRDYDFAVTLLDHRSLIRSLDSDKFGVFFRSSIKSIKNEKKLLVVIGTNELFRRGINVDDFQLIECYFKLTAGKYTNNLAKFELVSENGGFGLDIIVDPFRKIYYHKHSIYPALGLFESEEEGSAFVKEVQDFYTPVPAG